MARGRARSRRFPAPAALGPLFSSPARAFLPPQCVLEGVGLRDACGYLATSHMPHAMTQANQYKSIYGEAIPGHVLAERLGSFMHLFNLYGCVPASNPAFSSRSCATRTAARYCCSAPALAAAVGHPVQPAPLTHVA